MSETGMSTWVCDGHVLSVLSSPAGGGKEAEESGFISRQMSSRKTDGCIHTPAGPFEATGSIFSTPQRPMSWVATYVYLHSTATARSAEENFGASRAAAGVWTPLFRSSVGGGRPCVSLRSVENHLVRDLVFSGQTNKAC